MEEADGIIANVGVGISIFDKNLKLLAWNELFLEMLDYPPNFGKKGTPYGDFIWYNANRNDYGYDNIDEKVEERVRWARNPSTHDYVKDQQNGSVLRIISTPTPEGGFVKTYIDITEETRAKEIAGWNEETLQVITRLAQGWYWTTDSKCRLHTYKGSREMGGASADAALGLEIWETASQRDLLAEEKWSKHKETLDAHAAFRDFEYEIRSDPPLWMQMCGDPTFDEEGHFLGYRGFSTVITSRKLAELEVERRASEAISISKLGKFSLQISSIETYLQFCLEEILSFASVFNIEPSGGIFYTEKSRHGALLKLGANVNFANIPEQDCSVPDLEHCQCGHESLVGKIRHLKGLDEDHNGIRFEDAVNNAFCHIPIENRKILTGVIVFRTPEHNSLSKQDLEYFNLAASIVNMGIISRKTAVEIRESEERFSKAFESSPAAMTITNFKTGEFYGVNKLWLSIFGFLEKELIGKTVFDIKMYKSHEDRTGFVNKLKQHGYVRDHEIIFRTKYGEERNILLSAELIENAGEKQILGVVLDVTDRKQLEGQIRRTQKMNVIGQLVGGVAHDFNNILGIIMGNLEILEDEFPEGKSGSVLLGNAMKGVDRGASLTRKLLGFSRKGKSAKTHIAISEVISNIENLISKSLTASIKVEISSSTELWPTNIDAGDLEDALLNLSINARDAMPSGGCLSIETENKILEEDYIKRNPEGLAGEFVMISVSDTGTGMDEKTRERVLEPFFTTKVVGKGTGLGLSMVYQFVKRSGGHLKIYSEIGRGTVFRLYFPRFRGVETIVEEQKTVPLLSLKGRETILIVDDEKALRDVASIHLTALGYKTIMANNSATAMDVLGGSEKVDLLFTDIIMPDGSDGYDLALRALEQFPALKVQMASGFTKKLGVLKDEQNPILATMQENLLSKPYNRLELAQAIRNALDRI